MSTPPPPLPHPGPSLLPPVRYRVVRRPLSPAFDVTCVLQHGEETTGYPSSRTTACFPLTTCLSLALSHDFSVRLSLVSPSLFGGKCAGPDEYVEQMTTFLERHYLAAIHATIVSAEDQEKDYALAVK